MRANIFLLALVLLWAAGCSPVSGTPVVPDYLGTYNLVSIDGHPVPYAPVHQGQQAPEIVSSSLTLNEDGTFTMTMSYTNPSGGTISNDFAGTYTQDGTDFMLKWEGAGQTKVTIEGGSLTLNNEGMLFSYEK